MIYLRFNHRNVVLKQIRGILYFRWCDNIGSNGKFKPVGTEFMLMDEDDYVDMLLQKSIRKGNSDRDRELEAAYYI